MLVGEKLEFGDGGVVEDGGGLDGAVVDASGVDEVEYWRALEVLISRCDGENVLVYAFLNVM